MKNIANIILILLTAISTYVIIYVGLGIGWPIGTSDNYERINKILENLSYSYLAGCLFYLLTTEYSYWNRKQRLKFVMKSKMHKIVGCVDDVILEFSRDVKTTTRTDTEDVRTILLSKSWTETIPMIKQLNGVNISHIAHISLCGKSVKEQVLEIIQLYKEYLDEEQITRLEGLANMEIFRTASLFSSFLRINLDDPNGKKFLVDEFIKMYEELKSIERTFQ